MRLFIDYIRELKDPAAKMVKEKIENIKNDNQYKGYEMPISPITNILESYGNELEYATDLKSSTTVRTMVKSTSTLAYKLQAGEYGDAVVRLEEILNKCGIDGKDATDIKWSSDDGVIGDYKSIFNSFKNLVDGYLSENKAAEHWGKYFLDGPDRLKNMKEVSNLNADRSKISIYLESGLYEEIEEKESELLNQPMEFLQYLKKSLEDMEQVIGVIRGYIRTVQNFAREEKNKLYDDTLITSIEKIRRKQGKPASLAIDKSTVPSEKAYEETKNKISDFLKDLNKEGNVYFEQNGTFVKFDFYKKMVAANGELNWNEYINEKNELERLGFIRTKVEVL